MKKFLFPSIFILVLFACLPDEPTFDAFRRSEVQRLLSNTDSKNWVLKERILFNQEIGLETCDVPRQLIFNFTSATNDQDSLFYVNPTDECGSSTDTLKGSWYVPATITPETPIDTVVFVWEATDTAYFQIDDLNPESLSISSFLEKDSLKESFNQFIPVEEDSPEEEENE